MFDWRQLWQTSKQRISHFWGIEWSTEGLIGAAVRFEGKTPVLTDGFSISFSGGRSIDRDASELAIELSQKTSALGSHAPCIVIASRELVVTRQLQFPHVPEDELPALVSFQAAAKSSTPNSALHVDFIPLGEVTIDPTIAEPGGRVGQHVLATMLDAGRVQRLRDLITRARLTLIGLEVTPFLIAELVAREEERSGTPEIPTLIVAQSQDRVEISILDRCRLIATHAVWLPQGEGDRHVSPLQTEINRCLIALGETHPGVEVDQIALLQDETVDPEVVRVLTERFGEKVRPLHLDHMGDNLAPGHRLSYAAIYARGLVEISSTVPRVDLINPRKAPEKPDRTRRYWIAGGTAAALLVGGSWWDFHSQMTELDNQIETLRTEIGSNQAEVTAGKATIDAAATLSAWSETDHDFLDAWDQVHRLLPGTDRLYFTELKSTPGNPGQLYKFSGTARARQRDDIDDLLQRLVDAGWKVKPISPIDSKKDPDYPWQFVVDAELPRPVVPDQNPAASPAVSPLQSTDSLTGSTTVSSTAFVSD